MEKDLLEKDMQGKDIETPAEPAAENEVGTQETMEDYSRELEASFRKIGEGEIISGTVISVDEEEVILDLNYFAQGVIKAEDMSNDPKFNILEEVKIGSVIEATVVRTDDGAGNIQLSCKEAKDILSWDILKQYLDEEKEIAVKVSEVVNGGVIAYAEGIRGFIPASQLSLTYVEDLEPWKDKQLTVKVITVDEEKKKLVLSAKAVEKQKAETEINHRISMLVPGTVLEGTVESLMPYGAFIALAEGLNGLVHISQISVKRIKKPSEVLTVGDKVKVKVLNTNDHKISLSIKAVEEDSRPDEMEGKEAAEYSSNEEIGTSLGDLFKKLKL
ncbi:small subunit ribosomal protein S1 [Kineothrix alysoides]|uniref:Small subunit ribosomal protein S1 n=2 Tax=Kineothrix alysoides TaxID=1469948 RepID=A0A4V2QBU3_9FIRM|nr:S1 RNA-binding domain-containing protein [Kineothrix alysoides]TCL57242.1 small subunit ribosomal protein S1 [Kineothrix alysoides]